MIIYIDTSVIGGCFEPEFLPWSQMLFDQARVGKIALMISELTRDEIRPAPNQVNELLEEFPPNHLIEVKIDAEAIKLAISYIREGALGPKHSADAMHIALATIHRADFLASWNFKEMVNVFKIRQYNSINLKYGYGLIDIRTPEELHHEEG